MAAQRWAAVDRRLALRAAPPGSRADAPGVGTAGEADGSYGGQRQSEAPLNQLRRSGDGAARPRVLIIDDDDALCDAIRESLREVYAVASAPHGAAALDLVKVHEPVLILLDLRMPIMDGWSFVQQYRRVAAIPAAIVIMSAASDLPSIADQLGADGHLRKPFDLKMLDRLIAAQLDGRGSKTPRTDHTTEASTRAE